MSNPYLSIITPTYNRGHFLTECYQSLCHQTDKDFEWIIVDDGSTDNTRNVVEAFDTDTFKIIFVQKENGGKHTALNAAHPYIRGKYVLILDSDDLLTKNAVSTVREAWSRYDDNIDIGVVTFLRCNIKGDLFATVLDFETPVDILRYRRNVLLGNDCCEVIRTELFLQYPYPVFPGERFVSECALWNQVAQTHKCIYIDQAIYICEYLEGGLTDSGRAMRIRNPKGGMFICNLRMQKKNYLTQRIKYGTLYCCYGFFAGSTADGILGSTNYKTLTACCIIPGYLLYRYWKRKHTES